MCMIISKKFEVAPAVFGQNFTDLFGYSYSVSRMEEVDFFP